MQHVIAIKIEFNTITLNEHIYYFLSSIQIRVAAFRSADNCLIFKDLRSSCCFVLMNLLPGKRTRDSQKQ